jgi:hypothetical protein
MKWEYMLIRVHHSSYIDLVEINLLGNEGWELIISRPDGGFAELVFKRQKI